MTDVCQLTELPKQTTPEFLEFFRHFPDKYPFLLSTSSKTIAHPKTGRQQFDNKQEANFDILFIEPDYCLKMDHKFRLTMSDQRLTIKPDDFFLDAFDKLFISAKKNVAPDKHNSLLVSQLPFTGGWFVFFAYELAQQIEPSLKLKCEQQLLPVAYAARVKQALIFDHKQGTLFFLSEPEVDHHSAYASLLADIQVIQSSEMDTQSSEELLTCLEEEDAATFLKSAKRVHDYIKDGDVFQVNLSRLWKSSSSQQNHVQQAFSLAQKLNRENPAPFSGLASFDSDKGRATIVSSSPERLLKVSNQTLESRPIAGTRPRSASDLEDQRLLDELHAHPKEQAEHIMLIDLIRNDLGRVCIPGTVVVDELMTSESYAHVHHIVSNVIGKLQADKSPGDVIKALFPGGTITGCPKVRCLEIIAELEQHSRGAYTGSMGYINLDGSMDLNILIRTMLLEEVMHDNYRPVSQTATQQRLSFRAGAGLVFDSVANRELQETRAKAKGLLNTLSAQNHR